MLDPVDNPLWLKLMFFISFCIIVYAVMPPKKNFYLLIGIILLLFSAFIYFGKNEMGKTSLFSRPDGAGLFQ